MKFKIILFFSLLASLFSYSQPASRLLSTQATPRDSTPAVFLFMDTLRTSLGGQQRIYPVWVKDLRFSTDNIKGLKDSIINIGNSNGFVVWQDTTAKIMTHFMADQLAATKQNKFTGSTAYYIRGDGSLEIFPSMVNVSDTSQMLNKYLRKAQAIILYEPVFSVGTTSQYYRGDKTWQTLNKSVVGLSNVDNTSDASKPISTATQTVLNTKQDQLTDGVTLKTVNGQPLLGSGNVITPPGTVTSVGITSTDFTISSSPVITSGNIVANLNTSGVTAGTYEFITVNNKGIVTGGYNSVTNILSARTSGTVYQASNINRVYDLDFTISISIGAGLISASDGSVVLEISANGSTGWVEYTRSRNANGGVLAAQNTQVSYIEANNIPAGYSYRLVFTQNTGTASWTYINGHETLRK